MARTRSIDVDPKNVVVTPGGKPIIFFPMMALLGPGDEAIHPNPGFPIYESMIRYMGATPVPIPLVEERGFSFDLDVFRASLTGQDEDGGAEFAAESDGRDYSEGGYYRDCGCGAGPRSGGAEATRYIRGFITKAMRRSRLRACRGWRRGRLSLTGFRRLTR